MQVAGKQQAVKPFLKWAGGKGRLLTQLLPLFPKTFEAYYEPFFGGGAVFFAVAPVTGQINDINAALMGAYANVRQNVEQVIAELADIQAAYLAGSPEDRQAYYYARRTEYNQEATATIKKTSLLIFLNKTCFNGLYRENRKGQFNVPHGRYANPTICDAVTLRATARVLKYVQLSVGDFVAATKHAKAGDFVYFDPPYHPLNATSSFTSYSGDDFSADDQKRLKALFDSLTKRGVKVALSNSNTPFIRELYAGYRQETIMASRAINSVAAGRGKIAELVIVNY